MPEPDAILFPATDEALALKAHRLQRHTKEITPAQEIVAPEPIRAYRLPRPLLSLKTISLLLSLSCIFFLLASSLIAFALIGHHPFNAIASKPQVTVTSVATHVGQPASTTEGPAVILLFPSELQLMARKGENPHPTQIFITNTGGHTLNWTLGQNSDVNAPLLSVNTASGSLQPGEKATLLVSCVSDKLAPGSYHTELVVSDNSNEAAPAPQMLPVTLWVEESQ
ncbi:hypothetical protein KTT_41980 [Tengunoibacter tsumagoiensis]|uniref:Uncharacterized protein n=1 Tax=Tengunoibacter tsumagoiensis TaxID=2014871 RepID=A0A402A5I5_9CHLR|nr:hypothetical protein KTT_41980 [Tengunoibacter tsumagoiensis]